MNIKNILILLAVASAFIGCDDSNTDVNTTPSFPIEISADTLVFNNLGGASLNEVVVECAGEWELVGKDTWCEPSIVNGGDGAKIIFTAAINPLEQTRSLVYSFVSGVATKKLVILQEPKLYFEVDNTAVNNIEIGAGGGSYTVKIRTNSDYDVLLSEELVGWVVSAKKETGLATESWLSIDMMANGTYKPRTGTLTIKSGDAEPFEIVISQPQNNAIIVQESYDMDPAGGSLTINLKSNINYTLDIPTKYSSWITLDHKTDVVLGDGLVESTIVLNITASTGGLRAATISVLGLEDRYIKKEIVLKQTAVNPIYVTIPDANLVKQLKNKDAIVEIDVETNNYEITEAGLLLTKLDVYRKAIASMVGIEAFVNLEKIDCASNGITTLDFTGLTKLAEVSLNYAPLKSINLGDSKVTELSLSELSDSWQTPDSKELSIVGQGLLSLKFTTSADLLDLSGCPNLTTLKLGTYSFSHVKKIILAKVLENTLVFDKYKDTVVEYK